MYRRYSSTLHHVAVFAALPTLVLLACATTPRYTREDSPVAHRAPSRRKSASRGSTVGRASYYGPGFQGKKTASGERFDMNALTAAHRRLPFGTRVRVTNLDNGKSVVVRINDRGPFKKSRVIDLSLAAARKIGMTATGTARVKLEVLK